MASLVLLKSSRSDPPRRVRASFMRDADFDVKVSALSTSRPSTIGMATSRPVSRPRSSRPSLRCCSLSASRGHRYWVGCHRYSRLEAIASRLEAINSSRLEAIASRLEAINSSRLEAIASRLEAINSSRLEAIAIVGWRPSLVGWRPSIVVGWRPSLVGWRPSIIVGWRPSIVVGWRPSL